MTDGLPMRAGTAQELERVYEEYTPLLLSAVASLAKRGYDMHPAEGLELIHDFYIEALPGLLNRYDEKKARFSTYLYAAFLRFARPRLLRNVRWTRMFVPFEDAIAHPTEAADAARNEALLGSVARAMSSLPHELRIVVEGRATRNESERELARRLGVSRYVVRQRMAEALGRIAIAIGEDDMIPEDLRPLAIRLWRDGDSLMAVAAELGLTRQEAREHLKQLVNSLSAAAGSLPR
jgi:RNA polymerase sigma factor (sigma-70 family)